MLIKTVCSSVEQRTNQECVSLPSFCHTMDLQSCESCPGFFFLNIEYTTHMNTKEALQRQASCPCFYSTQLFKLCWETRNILQHWSWSSSRTVINTQKSRHILPAVHCDCLVVNRLTQMKFKQMFFFRFTLPKDEESSFFILLHVHEQSFVLALNTF